MRIIACLLGAALAWPAAAQEPSPVRDWIASHAIRLSTPEASHGFADMQPFKQVVADARIVELGEATLTSETSPGSMLSGRIQTLRFQCWSNQTSKSVDLWRLERL